VLRSDQRGACGFVDGAKGLNECQDRAWKKTLSRSDAGLQG
jgi:hypothetical protein